jgi:hypothetical protein
MLKRVRSMQNRYLPADSAGMAPAYEIKKERRVSQQIPRVGGV